MEVKINAGKIVLFTQIKFTDHVINADFHLSYGFKRMVPFFWSHGAKRSYDISLCYEQP